MKSKISLLLIFTLLGCNKAVVHGKVRPIAPIAQTYSSSTTETFAAAKKALTLLGYEIKEEDATEGLLRTDWRSTKSSSHYTELFDQKDYGTVGAYYRLEVKVGEQDGKGKVWVSAPVKSLVGHQKSTTTEEKKVLQKIGDLLRSPDFEMTNLGVD